MKKWIIRSVAFLLAALLVVGLIPVLADEDDTLEDAAFGVSEGEVTDPVAPVSEIPTGSVMDDGSNSTGLPKQVGINEFTDPNQIDEYEEVAADNGLTMFADMKSGKIAVRNDETGFIWYSTPCDRAGDMVTTGILGNELDSTLVVGYVTVEGESRVNSVSYLMSKDCIATGNVKVKKIKNGIRAVYDFPIFGFRVPVELKLEDGTLVASVPLEDILVGDVFKEAKMAEGATEDDLATMIDSHLTSVWVMPGFGAQNILKDGYIFVPDGSGAIVDFKPSYSAPNGLYEKTVYGEEKAQTVKYMKTYKQSVHMPVFGTVVGDEAVCGIVESGDEFSSILAYGSSNECGYTGISSRAVLHDLFSSFLYQGSWNEREVKKVSENTLEATEYRVRYTFLKGEDASYVGMAKLYQNYLVENEGLTKHETQPSLNVDMLGCIETDGNFIGFAYKKKMALTTFSQAETVIKDLQEAGIGNISTRLLGWTNNGLTNRKASAKADPLKVLGGNKAFASLAKTAAEAGAFYPEQDGVRYQSNGNGVSARSDCTKTAFGMPAYQYQYMLSVQMYKNTVIPDRLLSLNGLKKVADAFGKSFAKLNVSGMAVSNYTNHCYSDLGKANVYRDAMTTGMEEIMGEYAESYALEGNSANAYAFPYLTRILNVPLDSSQYDFFDGDVPFFSLVMHGYAALAGSEMNYSYDTRRSLLKSVETGSELHYVGMYGDSAELKDTDYNQYFSSTYTLWMDEAAEMWKEYEPLLKKIQNATITSHEEITDKVVATGYDNGVTVYVNYGTSDYTAESGVTVPAQGFVY